MGDDKKWYCQNTGCDVEIDKPQICCSGYDCGCMGLPVSPPFCSNKCYDEYIEQQTKIEK